MCFHDPREKENDQIDGEAILAGIAGGGILLLTISILVVIPYGVLFQLGLMVGLRDWWSYVLSTVPFIIGGRWLIRWWYKGWQLNKQYEKKRKNLLRQFPPSDGCPCPCSPETGNVWSYTPIGYYICRGKEEYDRRRRTLADVERSIYS